MVFNGEPSIVMPPPETFCDLDLWTDDLENVISIMWT